MMPFFIYLLYWTLISTTTEADLGKSYHCKSVIYRLHKEMNYVRYAVKLHTLVFFFIHTCGQFGNSSIVICVTKICHLYDCIFLN